MRNKFFILAYLVLLNHVIAQKVIVKGEISVANKIKIENATIVIYEGNSIIGYSYSNELGVYSMVLDNLSLSDTLLVEVNFLGYRKTKQKIIFKGESEIVQNFILEESVEELKEVVLEAWEKIKVNKDTITFRAASYSDGSEQSVEDLLKNLPGIEVLNDGIISVNGRSIDKLLIEGDDLFDEKYRLLSKNLDAQNISEVQILNNFEDNPVLKSFQDSEKVALNLKLKEEKKNVLFGNLAAGLGTNNRYKASGNFGLLGKKIKLFNLTNLNNTTELSTTQIGRVNKNLIGEITNDKIEKKSNELVNIDNLSNSNFSQNEDVFNNSFLNSFSFVTNLSQQTKLRSLSYYAKDKINKQNSNSIEIFSIPETIEFSEQRNINIEEVFFGTELELKHFSNSRFYLEYDFTIESNPTTKNSQLFNNFEIFQKQNDKKYNLNNHFTITKKLNTNKLLSIYSYYGKNSTNQNLVVTPNVFDENLNEENNSVINQNSDSPLTYTGFEANIISKYKKSEVGIEVLGGFEHDKINSLFSINNITFIDSLSNSTNYKKTNIGVTGRYVNEITDNLKITSSLNVSQKFISLNNEKNKFFFLNPKIGFAYKNKYTGNLRLNYSFNNNLPIIQNLNENFLLTNYRTFSKGLNSINALRQQNISLSYVYNSYKKLLLINSFFNYSFSNISYSIDNLVNSTSSFNNYTILDGSRIFNYNFGITTYLKKLPVSVRLSTEQSLSNNNVILNNIFGKIRNYNSNFRLQGTTYLEIPLNFKFHAQYNYFQGEFNSQSGSNSNIEAALFSTINFSKELILKLNNRYYSINSNNFFFNSLSLNYIPKNNKWSYILEGNNLSNISEFSNIEISEYQKNVSSFRIVPRYILLNIKYRF